MSIPGGVEDEIVAVPDSREIEILREGVPLDLGCTIYSIQAVAGIGTPGCMIAGIDYGRRADD